MLFTNAFQKSLPYCVKLYMGGNDLADILYIEFPDDINELTRARGISDDDVVAGLQDGSLTLQDFPTVAEQILNGGENTGKFIKNIADNGAKYIVVLNLFWVYSPWLATIIAKPR